MTHGDVAATASTWMAIAALGAFHGLNPAMGWLFAVALGLHRGARAVVLVSLAPILAGHAVAVALVLYAALALGTLIDPAVLTKLCGVALLAWAAWHALYGHRRRARVGLTTGLAGLALWSFLMASAHGAGLMLLPFALPLCGPEMGVGSVSAGLAVLAVHTAGMLAAIAVVSVTVYEWAGVGFLRRGWVNVDLLWSAALALSGAYMLFV